MKKIIGLGLLVLCAATLGSLTNPVINHKDNDLQTSTIDFVNEKNGIKKANVSKQVNNNKFSASKIYAQTAVDDEGFEYLRFATALRGKFDNVTYTRHIEGLEDKTDTVTTIYKGISANGVTTYSNGKDFVNYDVTSTKEYYWACYTIKFNKDSIYKNTDITVTLNVDGYVDTKTTSLEKIKNYVEDNSVKNLNFIESLNYANVYNHDYNYTLVSEKFNVDTYDYIHGACNDLNDDRYAYFSMNQTDNKKGIIGKYDFETKKIVASSKPFVLSNEETWSDNANIFSYKDKVYIIDSYGKFVSIKTSELTGFDSAQATQDDTTLVFKENGQEISNIKAVAYNKNVNKFAVYANNKLYYFNEELNLEKTITNINGLQTIYSDGTDLFGLIKNEIEFDVVKEKDIVTKGTYYDTATIKQFDWNGNLISTSTYGNQEKPIGEVYTVNRSRCTNIQNMIVHNGKLFFTKLAFVSYGNMKSGAYLYEFDTSALTKHSNTTLGEYVEKNDKASLENKFVAKEMFSRRSENGYRYLQGITTDGDNVYYSFTNGFNTKARIIRSNPLTGEWVSSTNSIEVASSNPKSADAGKIFFYNDNVWVTKFGSKTVVEVNKDTLVETGKTITFTNMNENIKNVAYDKFNNRLIILGTSGTLYRCENEETITKLADPKGFSGEYISNLFANDDYIYVTNTTNGVKGVKTSIFDFDGNLIKQVNVEDKLNISPETNNFNTQGLIDYKGAAIIIGLSWDGAYSGGYAYSISMK
ncbi:MAG: hypothetical protein V8R16_07140 [Bacilli bacterium]